MTYDWQALTPHKPLDPGAAEYVERPEGGAREIADWILAGGSALLLGGPTGVGKSTELAQAAKLLRGDRVACHAPLDRWENMRRITPDQLLLRIAGQLVFLAMEHLHLPVSSNIRQALVHAGVLDVRTLISPEAKSLSASAPTLARTALHEVARLSNQGKVTLLLDGLEKVPQGPGALELFDALGALPEDVELVVVVPWHMAFGPQSELAIRPGERFKALRALEIEGEAGAPGRQFLRELLARRLSVPVTALRPGRVAGADIVDDAVKWSGGIVRTFLQLVADSGTYARLRVDTAWPDEKDLSDAVEDQQDSFRRALLPGDTAAILAVEGTDGRELDLARKVRLMAHGVLLERLRDKRPILEIHPLARAAVAREHTNA